MKNWQFFLAILILVIVFCINILLSVKESLENDMIYDINNTINYKESNFNVMNRELIEKNKITIQEEDVLIEKNKQIEIDLPICSNNKVERTNYLNNVAIPNLNNVRQRIVDTQSESTNLTIICNSKNTYLTALNNELKTYNDVNKGIPYYTKEIDKCNKEVAKLELRHRNKRNLPTGYYSIKSVKTGRYCTDTNEGIDCNASRLQGWERFYIQNLGGGNYGVMGGNNNRWCADDGAFICNRGAIGAWEITMIIYEGNNEYSMRGGKDRRLCSNTGRITCNRDNYLRDEKFIIEPWPYPADLSDGTYYLQGGRDYKYCSDEGNKIVCNRTSVGAWEKFKLQNLNNGKYVIRGGKNGQLCANLGNSVECRSNWPGNDETYVLSNIGEDFYNIISQKSGKYCSDGSTFACNANEPRDWERIRIMPA